jgi:hypothetical protein
MSRVTYLGEVTGDNMQVTPDQLLDMIRADLDGGEHPIKGLFAVVVREAPDGTLHLDNYRCQLPKFVEVAVITRTFFRIVAPEADT